MVRTWDRSDKNTLHCSLSWLALHSQHSSARGSCRFPSIINRSQCCQSQALQNDDLGLNKSPEWLKKRKICKNNKIGVILLCSLVFDPLGYTQMTFLSFSLQLRGLETSFFKIMLRFSYKHLSPEAGALSKTSNIARFRIKVMRIGHTANFQPVTLVQTYCRQWGCTCVSQSRIPRHQGCLGVTEGEFSLQNFHSGWWGVRVKESSDEFVGMLVRKKTLVNWAHLLQNVFWDNHGAPAITPI